MSYLSFGNWEPRDLANADHPRNRGRICREGNECKRKGGPISTKTGGGFRIEEVGGLWFVIWLPDGWVPGIKTWGVVRDTEKSAEETGRRLSASMMESWAEERRGRNAVSKRNYNNKIKREKAMSSEQVESIEGGARIKDEYERHVVQVGGIKAILVTTRTKSGDPRLGGAYVLGLLLVRESFDLKEIGSRANKVFRGGYHEVSRLEEQFKDWWGLR